MPAYSPLKAIHLPSGEKRGLSVWPWKLVRRRAVPPARSTIQMLLAYAKAMCDALTVGCRNRRVCAVAVTVDSSTATIAVTSVDTFMSVTSRMAMAVGVHAIRPAGEPSAEYV